MAEVVADRAARVLNYHQFSKLTADSAPAAPPTDDPNRPNPHRIFEGFPKIDLPKTLLDLPGGTVSVLRASLEALPESYHHPPQNLRTLASWLYMAAGVLKSELAEPERRTCPSAGALYPCEIYVAVLGMLDLDPGLYHFSPKEFALRQLRQGPETLSLLRRNWPDAGFLKSVPAMLLVSTIYWRTAWKYRNRAYRYVLEDAGHLVQNLITAANGLGIQPFTRLAVRDRVMSDLIGIAPDADFGQAEAVQAIVAWSDAVQQPHEIAPAPAGALETLPRAPLSPEVMEYPAILKIHEVCVAPGVVMKELRPPATELSPLAPTTQPANLPLPDEPPAGAPLRQTFLARRSPRQFAPRSVARPVFWHLNRVAFRCGSAYPLRPDGPHVGIVRPFWLVHHVIGIDSGVWYYHPPQDRWFLLAKGDFRTEAQRLSLGQKLCAGAAAVCFMAGNLERLMTAGGPDVYRLAHLEAGMAGQRLALAATSLGLGATGIGAFWDDEIRKFLGLGHSHWEIIYGMAVGFPAEVS